MKLSNVLTEREAAAAAANEATVWAGLRGESRRFESDFEHSFTSWCHDHRAGPAFHSQQLQTFLFLFFFKA